MDVLSKLQDIFREIFDDATLVLTRETTPEEIEGWDSLEQINILMTCEDEFGIIFELEDIVPPQNVGDVVDMVERKLRQ